MLSRHIYILIILSCISAPTLLSQSSDRTSPSIALAYWNDDFLFRDRLNDILGSQVIPGSDDLHSAGFWFRLQLIGPTEPTYAAVRFDILTHRDRGYRIDMLEIRWVRRTDLSWARATYGIGGLFAGDLGGEEIQNAYHDLTGIRTVDLPYAGPVYAGARVLGSVELNLFVSGPISVLSHTDLSIALPHGPSLLSPSLSVIFHTPTIDWLTASFDGGYAVQGNLGHDLSPFSSSGLWSSQTLSIEVVHGKWINLWHTSNVFGRDQDHYGISYATEPHRILEAMW